MNLQTAKFACFLEPGKKHATEPPDASTLKARQGKHKPSNSTARDGGGFVFKILFNQYTKGLRPFSIPFTAMEENNHASQI